MSELTQKQLTILQRRRQVAELTLSGWTQSAIAEHLHVAQSTVSTDLQDIRQEWQQAAGRSLEDLRAAELQKLDLIEREAWAAWQRSQKPRQSQQFIGQEAGGVGRRSVANRDGDPRFLDQVSRCIAQRRSLLGLDPVIVQEELSDAPHALEHRRERIITLLTLLGERERTAATGAGPAQSFPRYVCAGSESGTLAECPAPGSPGSLPDPGPA